MCLVISIIMLVLSFKFYNMGSILQASGLLAVAIFFTILMVGNILYIKNLKKKKQNDN